MDIQEKQTTGQESDDAGLIGERVEEGGRSAKELPKLTTKWPGGRKPVRPPRPNNRNPCIDTREYRDYLNNMTTTSTDCPDCLEPIADCRAGRGCSRYGNISGLESLEMGRYAELTPSERAVFAEMINAVASLSGGARKTAMTAARNAVELIHCIR